MRLILGLLISFAAFPAQAQQQDENLNPPLSIVISTPQREIKVGSKVIVNIVLTNISGGTLQTAGLADYPSPHIYTIKLLDEKGALPPRTQIGRINLDRGIIIGTPDDFGRDFAAGETAKQTIELTTFFVLDSGMYTLQLERGRGNATIKSNTITFRVVPNTQLEGSVLDQTGGFIAGANVVLFSDDRVLTTKANESGMFRFADLPASAHFMEVSSPGFASVSIPITDKTTEPLRVTLWVGQSSGPLIRQCAPNAGPIPLPSVSYEPRPGNLQVAGLVTDASRVPSAFTSLTLLQNDLNAFPASGPNPARALGMKERASNERLIAEFVSNEKGEFRFNDLEPGWYTLKAAQGDSSAIVSFWVARENLTLSRIYLFPKDYNGCSILPGAFSTQDSPLPLTVRPPQK